MSSPTDTDVCRMAFEEGQRQHPVLAASKGFISEAVLEAMWDGAEDDVVETLAAHGNNVAARVLARRRQEAIEESLGEA